MIRVVVVVVCATGGWDHLTVMSEVIGAGLDRVMIVLAMDRW